MLFKNELTYNFYPTTNILHPIFLLMYFLLFLTSVPTWNTPKPRNSFNCLRHDTTHLCPIFSVVNTT